MFFLIVVTTMENKYVSFVSDHHLMSCIGELFDAYLRAKENVTKKKFYKNKIDIFKLSFDAHFNNIEQETIIETEILRQIDKSINNSIGTFHEKVLGGIKGFERGELSGFDIKAIDNTLFADIKNKHNTMNSSAAESLFQKLARYANDYKKANCYWVQMLAKSSFEEKWFGEINGKEYSHSRVYKISGDRFYARLTGQETAFYELYEALPVAIKDYLMARGISNKTPVNSALGEIKKGARESNRTIIHQITFENFKMLIKYSYC